jgi:hypothetical protein
MTPEGSTLVDTFTGTTSSISRTAVAKIALAAAVRERILSVGVLSIPQSAAPSQLRRGTEHLGPVG